MKIIITGSQGQLGLELQKQLERVKEVQVYSLGAEDLDITHKSQVEGVIQKIAPDVVINCAAYTLVDLCEQEQDKSYGVNAMGPYHLAVVCNQIGAKLVQVSTDYVFSGKFNGVTQYLEQVGSLLEIREELAKRSRPWQEEDLVAPQNIYGQTKWEGEEVVKAYCSKHFILRTAWLYGEGDNFVRTMLKLVQTTSEINVVGDQFGTPTYTKDLAKVIIELMQTEYYGTYHATCEGSCSWYDFACEIFRLKHLNVKVHKVTSEEFLRPAKRPQYAVLENAKLKEIGLNTFRPWQEALADYLETDVAWQEKNLGGKANG